METLPEIEAKIYPTTHVAVSVNIQVESWEYLCFEMTNPKFDGLLVSKIVLNDEFVQYIRDSVEIRSHVWISIYA